MKPIRLLLVDDHAVMRMGLASLLKTCPEFEVVGDCGDCKSALRKVAKAAPDTAIVDLVMPGVNGIETTRRLLAARPGLKILILTTFGSSDGIAQALEAGAGGAILKNAGLAELRMAIRTVSAGKRYVSEEIEQIMTDDPPLPTISPRQREILTCLTRGLENSDIARLLGISSAMVHEHLNALFAKIGAANRTEAVAIAFRRNLLSMSMPSTDEQGLSVRAAKGGVACALALMFALLAVVGGGKTLSSGDFTIRDPFLLRDGSTWHLYAQLSEDGTNGVQVYTSEDRLHWTPRGFVMTMPEGMNPDDVWAPEVHRFNDAYYLFVTLTYRKKALDSFPEINYRSGLPIDWPLPRRRGTWIMKAVRPTGPFRPLAPTSHTPVSQSCLDGTLWVEDGVPYMVYCHEWIEIGNGTVEMLRLNDDLTRPVGWPIKLFKASDAPNRHPIFKEGGFVTDGPFLYRSKKSGDLFMIWSSFVKGTEYSVLRTRSSTGKVTGPWGEQTVVYSKNGGHGMLFEDGSTLYLAIHSPNAPGEERLTFVEMTDDGELKPLSTAVPITIGSAP